MFGDNPAIDNGTPGGNEGGEGTTPPAGEGGEEASGVDIAFSTANEYTINPDNTPSKSVQVTYTDIGGISYHNISSSIATYTADNNRLTFTITNNGSADVRLRADMLVSGTIKNVNIKMTEQTSSSYTFNADSSYIVVVTGDTVTVEIEYAEAPDTLTIYVDSTYGDSITYSGDITMSAFEFSYVAPSTSDGSTAAAE